jgi:hypothetical protein
MEVASPPAQRIYKRARIEMEQGFFLNWVDICSRNEPVIQCVKDAGTVFIHMADTGIARINSAGPLAGMALDSGTRELFIEQRFSHSYLATRLDTIITPTGICRCGSCHSVFARGSFPLYLLLGICYFIAVDRIRPEGVE